MIEPTPETRPYWDALAEDRLVAQRCEACGRLQAYPRRFCEECGSEVKTFVDLGRRGRVHTFSVVHRAAPDFYLQTPYAVAIIEFENGHRLLAPVTGEDVEALSIGDEVELEPVKVGDLSFPCFMRVSA